MEIRNEVKTIRVSYKCPDCKHGYLTKIKSDLAIHSAEIKHYCNRCGFQIYLSKEYPYIEHVAHQDRHLGPFEYRYLCKQAGPIKKLLHGFPSNPSVNPDIWTCDMVYEIIVQQQDLAVAEQIYFKEDVDIVDIDGEKKAFIKHFF